eukprot:GDKK01060396.1.p1 GENE.GDKK01060396.1~~GDKK01060396.1.p1  ORF type:complete len:755 (-),score=210.40 GDKK01060396.1:59-2323(-)
MELLKGYAEQAISLGEGSDAKKLKTREFTDEPLVFPPAVVMECALRSSVFIEAAIQKKKDVGETEGAQKRRRDGGEKENGKQKRNKLAANFNTKNFQDEDGAYQTSSGSSSNADTDFDDDDLIDSTGKDKEEESNSSIKKNNKNAKKSNNNQPAPPSKNLLPAPTFPTHQPFANPNQQFANPANSMMVSAHSQINMLKSKISSLQMELAPFRHSQKPLLTNSGQVHQPSPPPYPHFVPDGPYFSNPANELFIQRIRSRWKSLRASITNIVLQKLSKNFIDRATTAGVPRDIITTAIKLSPCNICLSPAHNHLDCHRFGNRTTLRYINDRLKMKIGLKSEVLENQRISLQDLAELPKVRTPQMLAVQSTHFIFDVFLRPVPPPLSSPPANFIVPYLPIAEDTVAPPVSVSKGVSFDPPADLLESLDNEEARSALVASYQRDKLRESFACPFCQVRTHLLIECDPALCQLSIAVILEEHISAFEYVLSRIMAHNLPENLTEKAFVQNELLRTHGPHAPADVLAEEGEQLGRWVSELSLYLVQLMESFYFDGLTVARKDRLLFFLTKDLNFIAPHPPPVASKLPPAFNAMGHPHAMGSRRQQPSAFHRPVMHAMMPPSLVQKTVSPPHQIFMSQPPQSAPPVSKASLLETLMSSHPPPSSSSPASRNHQNIPADFNRSPPMQQQFSPPKAVAASKMHAVPAFSVSSSPQQQQQTSVISPPAVSQSQSAPAPSVIPKKNSLANKMFAAQEEDGEYSFM